jgi:hypothetical protein
MTSTGLPLPGVAVDDGFLLDLEDVVWFIL